jgi:hypothetical protein
MTVGSEEMFLVRWRLFPYGPPAKMAGEAFRAEDCAFHGISASDWP